MFSDGLRGFREKACLCREPRVPVLEGCFEDSFGCRGNRCAVFI